MKIFISHQSDAAVAAMRTRLYDWLRHRFPAPAPEPDFPPDTNLVCAPKKRVLFLDDCRSYSGCAAPARTLCDAPTLTETHLVIIYFSGHNDGDLDAGNDARNNSSPACKCFALSASPRRYEPYDGPPIGSGADAVSLPAPRPSFGACAAGKKAPTPARLPSLRRLSDFPELIRMFFSLISWHEHTGILQTDRTRRGLERIQARDTALPSSYASMIDLGSTSVQPIGIDHCKYQCCRRNIPDLPNAMASLLAAMTATGRMTPACSRADPRRDCRTFTIARQSDACRGCTVRRRSQQPSQRTPTLCFDHDASIARYGIHNEVRTFPRVTAMHGKADGDSSLAPMPGRQERTMKTPPSPRVSPSRGNGAPAVRWKPGQSGEVVAFPFALKSARAAPGLQIAWKSPMPDAANTDERGGIERSLVRDISLRNLGRNIERMLAQKGQWPHNDQPNGRCRK